MRTARALTVSPSMLCPGGVGAWIWSPPISPLGVGLDLIPLNFPLGCGPGSDPPQFPPRVWAWKGGVWSWRGVCSRGCLLLGGVCSWGGSARGVFAWGGVCSWGRSVCSGGIPACTEADAPPVNRITDTCKNITLPQLRCGR